MAPNLVAMDGKGKQQNMGSGVGYSPTGGEGKGKRKGGPKKKRSGNDSWGKPTTMSAKRSALRRGAQHNRSNASGKTAFAYRSA